MYLYFIVVIYLTLLVVFQREGSKLEYYENKEAAQVQLSWESISSGLNRQIISSSNLIPFDNSNSQASRQFIYIPEGENTATLNVTPIDDNTVEGNQTVKVTLLPDDTFYRINSSQASAELIIKESDRAGIEVSDIVFTQVFKEFQQSTNTTLFQPLNKQGDVTFVDIDGDKDVDAFLVNSQGNVEFYENIDSSVTKTQPQFQLNQAKNPFSNTNVGANSELVFVDIDNDANGLISTTDSNGKEQNIFVEGDLDAFVVQADGTVNLYENVDSSNLKNQPQLQANSQKNPFNNIKLDAGSGLTFVDVDADGDADAVVVKADSNIDYYQNTDNTTDKNQSTFQRQIDNNNPFKDVKPVGLTPNSIQFADIDLDADLDAVITTNSGSIVYYDNKGDFTNPQFSQDDEKNPFDSINPKIDLTNLLGLTYQSSGSSPVGEERDKAFDDNSRTKWLIFARTGWIQSQFSGNNAFVVDSYEITSANDFPERNPKDWKLLGSNDGVNFVELDNQVGVIFDGFFQAKQFKISNRIAYRFYRLDITSNNGADALQIGEIKLFGNNPSNNNAGSQLNLIDINGDKNLDVVIKKSNQSIDYYQNISEVKPVFTQSFTGVSTNETGTQASFGVRLSSQPKQNVTLAILTEIANKESRFDKTSLTFTPENWNQYQIVTVTGVDDNKFDGNIKYSLTIQGRDTNEVVYRQVSQQISITNQDDEVTTDNSSNQQGIFDNTLAKASIRAITPRINENSSTSGQFEITLDKPVEFPIQIVRGLINDTIQVRYTKPLQTQPEGFTLIPGSILRFSNGARVEVIEAAAVTNATENNSLLKVRLLEGTGLNAGLTGTALPLVKLNFGVVDTSGAGRDYQPIQQFFRPEAIAAPTTISYFRPTLVDINNDGDLDVFYGDLDGQIRYAENTGTTQLPRFEIRGDLNTQLNPFAQINANLQTINADPNNRQSGNTFALSSPTFVDLDRDGDQDAVVGFNNGKLSFFRNTGTRIAPAFTQLTGINNSFTSLTLGTNTIIPAFADLDRDGDLDLFVGSGNEILLFENTSTALPNGTFDATKLQFQNNLVNNIAKNPFAQIKGLQNPIPSFVDLDQDSDLDLVVKSANTPEIRYFINLGGASTVKPVFVEQQEVNNPFASLENLNVAPAFGDLNNDRAPDIFFGLGGQNFRYQLNQLNRAANINFPGEIKPGETRTTINVQPINDLIATGDKTVELRLFTGDNYRLTTQGAINLTDLTSQQQLNQLTFNNSRQIIASDNTTRVIRLNQQTSSAGSIAWKQPIALKEDGSFSTFLQLQVNGLTAQTQNERVAFLIGATQISLSTINRNGTWFVWLDYNGRTGALETRTATTQQRPQTATTTSNITRQALFGSTTEASGTFGVTATSSVGATYDLLQWQLLDRYDAQAYDPQFADRLQAKLTIVDDDTPGVAITNVNSNTRYNTIDNVVTGGLRGNYFNNKDFSGTPVLTRTDAQINFNWGTGSPDSRINSDEFSIRWNGYIQAPVTGTYNFYVNRDDGVRASINNVSIFNSWNNTRSLNEKGSPVTLEAGKWYPIALDYYENLGDAQLRLEWEAPGLSRSVVDSKYLGTLQESPVLNLVENNPNGTQTFSVALNSQPQEAVVVQFATNNSREGLVKLGNGESKEPTTEFVSLRFTPTNWNQAQQFTVIPQNDAIDDGNLPFQIIGSVYSADNKYDKLSLPQIKLANQDDDESVVLINGQLGDRVNIIEGVTDAYAVKLKSQPSDNTSWVKVTMTPLTEQLQLNGQKQNKPVVFSFDQKNWNQEQTVRVNAVDDDVVENTQTTSIDFNVTRQLQFNNFVNTEELNLQGNTKTVSRKGDIALRLTDKVGQLGTVFSKNKAVSLKPNDEFSTEFRFQINDAKQLARGVELVIAPDGEKSSKNVRIRLEPAKTGQANSNRIVIDVNGVVVTSKLLPLQETDSEGNTVNTQLNNGNVWNVWVDYDGTTDQLQVRVDDILARPDAATLTYSGIRMALGSDAAHLGLTATSITSQNDSDAVVEQDIISWTIEGNDPAYSKAEFVNSKQVKDLNQAPLLVEIKDNDLPTASIIAGPKALEVKSPSYFTIALDNVTSDAIGNSGLKVNYRIIGGSAQNNKDYQAIPVQDFVRIAPGEIQGNLLVFPIDDFLNEATDFDVTTYNAQTGNLGLRIANTVKIFDGTFLTFGKEGSNQGGSAKIILKAGEPGVQTDLKTGLRFIELRAGSSTSINLEAIKGNIETGSIAGIKAAPLSVRSFNQSAKTLVLEIGSLNIAKGSVLTLDGGVSITVDEDKLITTAGQTVKVTPKDTTEPLDIQAGQKASLNSENISIELLPGDGYKISPIDNKATLEIVDNDVPGVRIASMGDRVIVEEGKTTQYAISLTSEPEAPVSINLYHDKQIRIINPSTQQFEVELNSVFEDSKVGNLEVRLFKQPTELVTLEIPTKDGSIKTLQFTSANWNQLQSVNNVSLNVTGKTFKVEGIKQDNSNTSFTFEKLGEDEFKIIPNQGASFSTITFNNCCLV